MFGCQTIFLESGTRLDENAKGDESSKNSKVCFFSRPCPPAIGFSPIGRQIAPFKPQFASRARCCYLLHMSVVFSKRIKVEAAASPYGQSFITTACPVCSHKWRLSDREMDSGGPLQCPACKHIFHAGRGQNQNSGASAGQASPEEAKKKVSATLSPLQRDLMALKIAAHEHAQGLVPVTADLDASAARIAYDMGAASAGAERPSWRAMNKNIVTLGQKILISNPDASASAEVLVPHRFEREAPSASASRKRKREPPS